MTQRLANLFKETHQMEPPKKLAGLILKKIDLEKSRSLKNKLYVSYLALSATFISFIWALIYFGKEILNSDFASLLSLFASDAILVARNWNDYLFSLLETLPLFSLSVIAASVVLFLLAINFYAKTHNRQRNVIFKNLVYF